MPLPRNFTIDKRRILMVEGQDDKTFFEAFLDYQNFNNVQVVKVDGKKEIHNVLPTFVKLGNFDKVEILSIIIDADSNANNSFKSVCGSLKKANLTEPSKIGAFIDGNPGVGVFILPDNNNKGMLEDLCLASIKNTESFICVKKFKTCIKSLKKKPKVLQKSLAQCYLATLPKFCSHIGIAAQKKYWDFDSVKMKLLKTFIKKLAK